jgi:hypothetical protein
MNMSSVDSCLQLLKEILESKEEMGDTMRRSFFSMTEAKYAAGDNIKHTIFDNVDSAQVPPLLLPPQPKDWHAGASWVGKSFPSHVKSKCGNELHIMICQ